MSCLEEVLPLLRSLTDYSRVSSLNDTKSNLTARSGPRGQRHHTPFLCMLINARTLSDGNPSPGLKHDLLTENNARNREQAPLKATPFPTSTFRPRQKSNPTLPTGATQMERQTKKNWCFPHSHYDVQVGSLRGAFCPRSAPPDRGCPRKGPIQRPRRLKTPEPLAPINNPPRARWTFRARVAPVKNRLPPPPTPLSFLRFYCPGCPSP